ncbi:MAG: transglycosylase SLT domain-containing protein [Betaproteobacteria bacterium]|nr:transglycosylase SLT domain-containing protein [Betaproteobacteria bacterium]
MTSKAKIVISAIDDATAVVRKIRAEMRSIGQPMRDVKNSMRQFMEASGLKDMQRKFGKIAHVARSVAGGITRIVAPMAALVGAATLAGIAELTSRWGQLGLNVLYTSQNIGVAPGKLQALQSAAKLAGLSADDMTSSLGNLGNTLEDALYGRNQKALYMLNQLGVHIHKTKNGAVDSTRALSDLSGVIQKYNGRPQVQKQIADTFGVGSLLPLLRQGPAAIRRFELEAKKLGAVLSGPELANARTLGLSFLELKVGIKGIGNSISNALFPVLTPLIAELTNWIMANRQLIATKVSVWLGEIASWIRSVDWSATWKNIKGIASEIGTVASDVNGAAQALGGWKTTFELAFGALALTKIVQMSVAIYKVAKALRAVSAAEIAGGAAGGAGILGTVGKIGLYGWLANKGLTALDPRDSAGSWIDQHSSIASGIDNFFSRFGLGRSYSQQAIAAKRAQAKTLFPKLESMYGLPHGLLDAVWAQESGRGKNMVSPAGALGDFQFMPKTAAAYGITDPGNLRQAAGGAAMMYRNLLDQYGGNTAEALAAYNWGSGNLNKDLYRYGAGWMSHAPRETQNYVRDVMARMHAEPHRVEVHVRMTGAPHGTRVEARDSHGREVPARIGYNYVGVDA